MIEEGNYEGAEHRLGQVNVILEEIRNDLYDDQEEDDERLASDTNATSSEDVEKAEKLIEIAARYEEDALKLLNETGANPTAAAKLQEALSLVASARAHIDAKDLEEAREDLRAVYRAIEDAKDLIEHEGDNSSGSNDEHSDDDNSGESSDDNSNSSSGKGKGNDKEGEEDDEDDKDSGNRGRGHDDE
jgi:hypothetical protein